MRAGLPSAFSLWLLIEMVRGGIPWTPLFGLCLALLWALSRHTSASLWKTRPATAIFLAVLAVYLSTFRWHGGDDTPNSLLPFCLLRYKTLAMNPVIDPWFTGKTADFILPYGPYRLSVFPVLPGLLAIPVYIIPILAGIVPNEQFLHNLSKISGSLLVAASVVLFFQAVRKRCSHEWALTLTFLYGLGSWAFSVSSQSLWQHAPASAGIALALWGLNRQGLWNDFLVGLGAAGAVASRPDSIFFAAAIGLYILFHDRRRLKGFIPGAALPALFLVSYWFYYTGRIRPPESEFQARLFTHFQWDAFIGMILSPTRGLIFFFPAAVFGLLAGFKRIRDSLMLVGRVSGARLSRSREPLIAWLMLACVGPWALMSFYDYWVGGNTYGPRYFAVAALVWIYFLADPKIEKDIRSNPTVLKAFAGVFAFCVLVHALGGYMTWPGDQFIAAEKANVWNWNLHPVIYLFSSDGWLRQFPAAARLMTGLAILATTIQMGRILSRRLTI